MQNNDYFAAPWGLLLRAMTVFSVGLLGTMLYIGLTYGPEKSIVWNLVMIALPPAIVIVAFFFTIRGYFLFEDTLFIQRIGWYSKVSLAGLQSVEFDPEATTRAIRRFGNGGMFCFAGFYKSKKLGPFRAFATDLRRPVVLRLADDTVVITPDDPVRFVRRVKELKNL